MACPAPLTPAGLDEAVDLSVATLHVFADFLFCLGAERACLLGGLGAHRREQLLGCRAGGEEFLRALLLGIRGDPLCLLVRA